jgi:AcrR family transcriptional regulator
MVKKAPRRTAERILTATLQLFNRYGEPNVATTLIASDMGISPGNLFYHYASKEALVNALFDACQEDMVALLPAAGDVRDLEDTWFFMHSLFELIWRYRFLYRDLNDLLSKNRHLEAQVKDILALKEQAFHLLLAKLDHAQLMQQNETERASSATQMVVMLTWWLSYEYVRNPRHAMEDGSAEQGVLRGAQQVLGLLLPYLKPAPQAQLQALMQVYAPASTAAT